MYEPCLLTRLSCIAEELFGAFEGTDYTPLAHLSWTDVEDMSQLPQSDLMSERADLGSDGVDDSGSGRQPIYNRIHCHYPEHLYRITVHMYTCVCVNM